MIKNIINDIELAKNSKAYLSALALALTLPEICGKIETATNTKKSSKYYIDWYNKWVYKYYRLPPSKNPLIEKAANDSKLDGKFCYDLRNAVLHCGNTDLHNNNEKISSFFFTVSDNIASSFSVVCSVSENGAHDIQIHLNIINLIDTIISGVKDFLKENKDTSTIYGNINIEFI